MTMPSRLTGGVDTHLDVHVAAALDERGGLLGVETFPTTPAGYRQLWAWLGTFGTVDAARATRKTRSALRGRHSPVTPAGWPRPVTATSNRCGSCALRAGRLADHAPKR